MAGTTLGLLVLGLAAAGVARAAAAGGPLRNTSTQKPIIPQPVMQEVHVPTRAPPLSYFLPPRFTPRDFLWDPQRNLTTSANNSGTNKPKSMQGVKLPPLPCERDQDCWQYTDPLLECRQGQCTCSPPFCWVYHYEVTTAFSAKYVFNCDTCGILGSWCNASIACDWPGVCWSDNYCHCPRGENDNNVCPPWRQPEPWCCGLCPGAQGYGRRRSIEKSPAYTLQNHYAVHESVLSPRASDDRGREAGSDDQGTVAGSDDQGTGAGSDDQRREDSSNIGEVAIERRQRWRHRSISEVSSDVNGGTSSISSLSTTVTSISEASTATAEGLLTAPQTPPVSHTVTNILPEGSDDREKVFTISLNVPLETVNFQAPPEKRRSIDGSSGGSPSSSCSHERCSLCLPKGPLTRPPSLTLTDGSGSGSQFMIHPSQTRDLVETDIVIESTHL
nr:uncharacterized protein LOC123746063 isoform X2 [Procambarus clarkii]